MRETARWWVEQCLAAARAAAEAVEAGNVERSHERVRLPKLLPAGKVEWETGEEIEVPALNSRRENAAEAASTAFLAAMPPLVDRAHTTAYIACVAAGLGHRYINALEAKSLMYSAQLALAAHRPRQRRRQTTPTPTPVKPGVGASLARLAGNVIRGAVEKG